MRLVYFSILLILSGCASHQSSVSSLANIDNQFLQHEDERKLHRLSKNMHQELVSKGLIVRDVKSNTYIRLIAEKLIPVHAADHIDFEFFILKSSTVNAFAMPNGNIYLNIGLLAKLDNEAELAHVLAHEIAHVVERHSYKSWLNRTNTVVAANIVDVFTLGMGLAYIPAGLDLASHSRDQEQDADHYAISYLMDTDYDIKQSIDVFNKLVVTKYPNQGGSIWSSHPDSKKRNKYSLAYISSLTLEGQNKYVFEEEYEVFRRSIVEFDIQLRIRNMHFELAEDAVEREKNRQGDDVTWELLLGNIYYNKAIYPKQAAKEYAWLHDESYDNDLTTLFAKNVDVNLSKAREYYQGLIEQDGTPAEALKGLGLVAYRSGEFKAATAYLKSYLLESDKPKDQKYIERILSKISKEKK